MNSQTENLLWNILSEFKLDESEHDAAQFCSRVEESIPSLLLDVIMNLLISKDWVNGVKFSKSSENILIMADGENQLFEIWIGMHAESLRISIEAKPLRMVQAHLSRSIIGNGRCRTIELEISNRIGFLAETILKLAIEFVELVYRWLTETLFAYLDRIHMNAIDDVYRFIRTIVPTPIAEQIWLYVVYKDRGLYVLDYKARSTALDAASRRSYGFATKSPLENLATFSTVVLDAGQTFSRAAIMKEPDPGTSNVKVVEGSFTAPPYAATGIQIAEMEIYEADTNCVQALVWEGQLCLAAGYPTVARALIADKLAAHTKTIRDLLQNKKSKFDSILQSLYIVKENKGLLTIEKGLGLLARVGGMFAGEAIKHASH